MRRAPARQAGALGDFGQRLLRRAGVEGADHREAAREGLDVAVAGARGPCRRRAWSRTRACPSLSPNGEGLFRGWARLGRPSGRLSPKTGWSSAPKPVRRGCGPGAWLRRAPGRRGSSASSSDSSACNCTTPKLRPSAGPPCAPWRCPSRATMRPATPIASSTAVPGSSTANSSPPRRPGDVGCARLAHAATHLAQRGVAGGVALLVADALEVVDVEHHQRARRRHAFGDARRQLVEVPTVGHAGEHVDVGEEAQLAVHLMQLRLAAFVGEHQREVDHHQRRDHDHQAAGQQQALGERAGGRQASAAETRSACSTAAARLDAHQHARGHAGAPLGHVPDQRGAVEMQQAGAGGEGRHARATAPSAAHTRRARRARPRRAAAHRRPAARGSGGAA